MNTFIAQSFSALNRLVCLDLGVEPLFEASLDDKICPRNAEPGKWNQGKSKPVPTPVSKSEMRFYTAFMCQP